MTLWFSPILTDFHLISVFNCELHALCPHTNLDYYISDATSHFDKFGEILGISCFQQIHVNFLLILITSHLHGFCLLQK